MTDKFTFYICSDNITKKSEDKARINKFIKAFKTAGYNARNCGVGSDNHSHPDKYGCTGSAKKVWVCVVGGDCAGTYRDMASKSFTKKLKGSKILFIRQFGTGITKKASQIKTLNRAWDDNFSKNDPKITGGLDNFFTKNGMSYLEGTTDQIINDIKAGNIKGKGLSGFKGDTHKYGYSTSNPFTAYLNIQYTKDVNWDNELDEKKVNEYNIAISNAKKNYDNGVKKKLSSAQLKNLKQKITDAENVLKKYIDNNTPQIKNINVDFSMNAPEAVTTDKIGSTAIPPSFSPEENMPSWLNNTIREHWFNLLKFIQIAENDINGEHTYYLYKITFKAEFGKDNSGNLNDEKKDNVLYTDDDQASYKMNLYSIGLYEGDSVSAKNYGSSGKKINEVVKSVLEETNYYPRMVYGKYRHQDRIVFTKVDTETKPVFDFYDMEHWKNGEIKDEIVDGNILNLSNVQYTPINNTLNNSIYIFKGRYDVLRDEDTLSYFYERYSNLDKILKYGEQTLLGSDTNNNMSSTEAYNNARTNYLNNYEERRSYTIKVAGIPPVNINDFVRTYMNNSLLDSGENGLKVSSIEWNIDPSTSPCISSSLGLGKPDKKFEIAELTKIQRERQKNKALDIPVNVRYNGDENMEGI